MQTHYNNSSYSAKKGCVATIGMFDGVHCGHVSLLNQLKVKAKEIQLPSAVVTFWPHPKAVLQPSDSSLKVLSSLTEKLHLLEQNEVDEVFVVDFSLEFSRLTPQEFIREYLLGKFGVKHLLMGYNHHFGAGQYQLTDYEQFAAEQGLSSSRFREFRTEGGQECSSSEVRRHLAAGKVREAAKILGYEYSVQGKVVRGDAFGRKIGYPTANILLHEEKKMLPADGVYAAWCKVGNNCYKAVVDVGYRPTVGGSQHRVEVHLIDFNCDIYDDNIEVTFAERIRNEKRFASVEELKATIAKDVVKANEMLQNVEENFKTFKKMLEID